MYETIEILRNDIRHQKYLLKMYKQELKRLPKGVLIHRNINGKNHIYYRMADEASKKIHERALKDTDIQLMGQIKRRRYIKESIPLICKNIELLTKCLSGYNMLEEKNICADFGRAYQGVECAKADYEHRGERKKWNNLLENQNVFDDYKVIHNTSKGKVRSKSELILTMIFDSYKIPYKYEVCLDFGKEKYYPDFALMNPIDDKIIFWEHFGLVNDKDYVEHMEKKLAIYRMNGLTLWDNLIISFDRPNGTLDACQIERLVKAFFTIQ